VCSQGPAFSSLSSLDKLDVRGCQGPAAPYVISRLLDRDTREATAVIALGKVGAGGSQIYLHIGTIWGAQKNVDDPRNIDAFGLEKDLGIRVF